MIISIEDGRLGNQLFQYAALKKLFPTEKLVLVGYDALDHMVEPIEAKLIKKSQLPSWLPLILVRKFFFLLSDVRLLSSISEKQSQMSYWLETKKGLICNINVLKSTFFQNTNITEGLRLQFHIRECHRQKAKCWISKNIADKCQKQLVFIHIRRGDYLIWPDRYSPAVLDLDWYLKAMEYMGTKINNPLFIILTDDIYYAKDVFSKCSNVVISENCQYVDLALMTQCSMGILSASSFAWWGAWFSIQNEKDYNIYIAPKYWGGHRNRRWYPEGFVFDWITYF